MASISSWLHQSIQASYVSAPEHQPIPEPLNMWIIVTLKNYYARCTFCGSSDESEKTCMCQGMLEHVQQKWQHSKDKAKPAQTKVHNSESLLEAVVWRLLSRLGFLLCFSVPPVNAEIVIHYRNWLHPHLPQVPLGAVCPVLLTLLNKS